MRTTYFPGAMVALIFLLLGELSEMLKGCIWVCTQVIRVILSGRSVYLRCRSNVQVSYSKNDTRLVWVATLLET